MCLVWCVMENGRIRRTEAGVIVLCCRRLTMSRYRFIRFIVRNMRDKII